MTVTLLVADAALLAAFGSMGAGARRFHAAGFHGNALHGWMT